MCCFYTPPMGKQTNISDAHRNFLKHSSVHLKGFCTFPTFQGKIVQYVGMSLQDDTDKCTIHDHQIHEWRSVLATAVWYFRQQCAFEHCNVNLVCYTQIFKYKCFVFFYFPNLIFKSYKMGVNNICIIFHPYRRGQGSLCNIFGNGLLCHQTWSQIRRCPLQRDIFTESKNDQGVFCLNLLVWTGHLDGAHIFSFCLLNSQM